MRNLFVKSKNINKTEYLSDSESDLFTDDTSEWQSFTRTIMHVCTTLLCPPIFCLDWMNAGSTGKTLSNATLSCLFVQCCYSINATRLACALKYFATWKRKNGMWFILTEGLKYRKPVLLYHGTIIRTWLKRQIFIFRFSTFLCLLVKLLPFEGWKYRNHVLLYHKATQDPIIRTELKRPIFKFSDFLR